ncbi:xanthine dehydrogenase family protein molybdopterin-binding subunit [Rhodoplanes sp. Z2-YC6860]|uniref:xanthine dehydrogenase family protein molybdopterin-binding subunit n=1 Tax=Rhodoplanes sp. Z2-YC6860 TaxID=674703 RepID=UPI00078C28DC|nr:xanthine dehydrogenase family protein molybdopterin-binding subunit [Rhodoplanes sp. Z2-YC6860]AMN44919.1 dehydrogenase/oxidase [Rhodoplanes sp. Z2-YC6860]
MSQTSTIGSRIVRLEDEPLLRGKGRFVDDIKLPGVWHAAFVRSPHPHALIKSIDKDAALAMPGVHAVLTLDDLSEVMVSRRMVRHSNSGMPLDKCWAYALAPGEVSYVGEPVALVIADARYLAEDAAALVMVDYEPLPVAADVRTAKESAPVRRELNSNVITTYKVSFGDADAGFAKAAHVFKQELWQHRGGAHSIETRGIVAEVRSADGGITVHASTQKAHDLNQSLTLLMDFDQGLRVVAPDIGGGFGAKLCVYSEDVAVVAAAKLFGHSIKWAEDRREYFTNAVHERDQYWQLEIAVDADAKVLGIRGKLLHDTGAYTLQDPNIPYNSTSTMSGPYIIPGLSIDVTIAMTNKTPVSSVRGAGYPQAAFAMERLLDLVAREMKLDRAEVRRRNLIPASKMPYRKALKARSGAAMEYDSGDYPACQSETLKAIGWDDFKKRQSEMRAKGRYLGQGLAHGVKGSGRGPFESGLVRVSRTGKITVFTGASAMGQGLGTALAQVAAAQLGVDVSRVKVVAGDTGGVSLGLGGFASRQTVTAGSSVHLAAKAVAEKAKKVASHVLEADENDLELKDGEVRVAGAPQLNVKLSEIARILAGAPGYGFPAGVDPGLEANANWRTDALAYANGCHACEVEVDAETGEVRIVRYVAMQDSGILINPMMVEGQIHGGVVHGIGNALYEWMGYDEAGQPVTTNFADYMLPTSTEVPMLDTLYKETRSPLNPLGVKGVGEAGTIPCAAALISAVEDALSPFGVRIGQVPLPPMTIMSMILNGK